YTIKVINNGEAPAENIIVKDILPEGFITNDDNSSEIVWNISALEIGEKWEKTFSVYIKSTVKSGSYENIVTIEADNNPEVQGSVIVKIGSLPYTAGGVDNFFDLYRLGSSLAKIEKDWLMIPSIGVEIPVVAGNSESALEKGVWLLPGGSTPSAGGNTAFAAHRYKYRPPHKQTFYLLDEVEIGDSVKIYWKGDLYNYTVFESIIVSPDDIGVLNQTDESIITLITCTPLFSDKHRLIVKAKLI
ncbi:sortase, partial [Patescibacteria group bacterium]|nr:sortase [Patescibacteria group bacterium]